MGNLHPSFSLLSAFRDGEAAPEEATGVASHLPTCSACRNTLQGFDLLARSLSSVPVVPCATAQPLLSAQLDGQASSQENAIASRHLHTCADCALARSVWYALDDALRALPAGVPSAATDARIRATAHRRPAFTPPAFGMPGRAGLLRTAAIAIVVVLIGLLPRGPGGPELGAVPGEQVTLVASVQQVYDPGTSLLYTLRTAPDASVLVRSVATQQDVATIAISGTPEFLALDQQSHTLYVLDPAARQYTVIDTTQQTVSDRVSLAVAGTPTSIGFDVGTGRLLVTTAAVPQIASLKSAEIAVFDPGSKTLETVKQIDVTPTVVVVDQRANRLFLLGPTSTSVLNASTYERADAIAGGVVGIAVSATGGADAILAQSGTTARLRFYRGTGGAELQGTAIGVSALPDGGFAVLYDAADGGRIALVGSDGTPRGPSFALGASARGVAFDPGSLRFFDATGAILASVASGAVVAAVPTPTPTPAATPSNVPPTTAAVSPPASPTPTPATAVIVPPTNGVVLPAPSAAPSLFPGAILSSTGIYRYEMPGGTAPLAVVSGNGGRIWFTGADSTLRTVDPASGKVAIATRLGPDARATMLAFGAGQVFALDVAAGNLFVFNTSALTLQTVSAPFGRSITGMDVGPDGRLWLAAGGYSGLVVYDPRTTQFEFVALGRTEVATSIAVDGANRVWFYNTTRRALGSYEPSSKLLSYTYLPPADLVTALATDRSGNVWIGTAAGRVSKVSIGVLSAVATVGGSTAAFARTPDGSVAALFNAGPSTLVGRPGGPLMVASGNVASLAVDGGGHLWLADPTQPVFYVSEPR